MSNISVIGAGYVGLVTAACFSEMGNRVTLIEIDQEKVNKFHRGVLPVHETGLPELWQRNWAAGKLRVTGEYREGLKESDFAFITVGTPSSTNGKPDLKWVRLAARSLAENADKPMTIVMKSTVPVGTAETVSRIISRHRQIDRDFPVVSNPEFLREGMAVFDFMHPTRIVIGAKDKSDIEPVARLYETIHAPLFTCSNRTAEMSKYASNVFLANRISFMNEISLLCDELEVDVVQISKIVGLEPRCGEGYLRAGLGWGGSCLPKDVKGLLHMGKNLGISLPIITATQQINQRQIQVPVRKLQRLLGPLNGKTIGILGLAFKPDSNDLRDASSLLLISLLRERGCIIKAYDPVAMDDARGIMPSLTYCNSSYEVAENSDALILVTEWDEFKNLDLVRLGSLMKNPVLIDGRNFYDPDKMVEAGFIYEGIGRSFANNDQSFTNTVEKGKELQPVLGMQ
jgi:UDPglucose 6-dehydrogenase